ncbi:MAG TPA: DUF2254 domain-containing protein [Saprospiraceae bacterium]|nr:DUF2254 domain-containing protein [Saprospiraceae bacterium]
MKKLLFYWRELLATFWFVPVILIVSAVFLAVGLVSLDNVVDIPGEGWVRFFLVDNSASARSILSTISGAMIGVAGTVFSVTLVALTLASSQFGPRLIKNFMYVRLNQVVLGAYIATYLYCLLVLNTIKDGSEYVFIPSISILVAILAAVGNIILLIIFIHQIAVSIQADKVISDISGIIYWRAETLFPEKMGEEVEEEDFDADRVISGYEKCSSIKSPESGYLQYLNSEALLEIVVERDALFKLDHRPGSFLVKGGEIGLLYTNEDWEKEAVDELLSQFVFGKTKTSQQDLEFSIHQMVEIAARALSPGVNDPYSAIACIDNLTATMCYLAEAKFPSKYRIGDDGKLRVIADVLEFEGVLDAAFNQIRQFSGGSTSVIIRLMEALTTILKFTKRESHKNSVIYHAEMVLRMGKESIKEKSDLDDLEERARQILEP